MPEKNTRKKIMLAYSGGLDTSVILKYLQNHYNADVYAYMADLGQGEDLVAAKKKALSLGAKKAIVEDLTEEFVSEYVFKMMMANTLYEGDYLLGTSIARPLIAKAMVKAAYDCGCDSLAHGATGRGNDQLRFEYAFASLAPDLEVIAPWRVWDLNSRERLIDYAREHQISIPKDKLGQAPFSVDANILHCSAEGKELEDPAVEAGQHVYSKSLSPLLANKPVSEKVTIAFKKGRAISINQQNLSPAKILEFLNKLGSKYGIGRLDMVETRTMGTKSRGIYECPGGTILLKAHRSIEHITLDGKAIELKDEIMPRYARLIYDGLWFSPERRMLQALIDESQQHVEGSVDLVVAGGYVATVSRQSNKSLYRRDYVTFEDSDELSQTDASGYIKVNSLRLKLDGNRQKQN